MRASTLLVLAAAVAALALAWLVLRPREGGPSDETPANGAPPARPPEVRRLPTATAGILVIRVRTPDAMPLPPGTRAGYQDGRDRRMRTIDGEGTFRFTDVPVGKVEVVAEAEGYSPGTAITVVEPEVPGEVLVTLEPKR